VGWLYFPVEGVSSSTERLMLKFQKFVDFAKKILVAGDGMVGEWIGKYGEDGGVKVEFPGWVETHFSSNIEIYYRN
jgi:hypothetical protein